MSSSLFPVLLHVLRQLYAVLVRLYLLGPSYFKRQPLITAPLTDTAIDNAQKVFENYITLSKVFVSLGPSEARRLSALCKYWRSVQLDVFPALEICFSDNHHEKTQSTQETEDEDAAGSHDEPLTKVAARWHRLVCADIAHDRDGNLMYMFCGGRNYSSINRREWRNRFLIARRARFGNAHQAPSLALSRHQDDGKSIHNHTGLRCCNGHAFPQPKNEATDAIDPNVWDTEYTVCMTQHGPPTLFGCTIHSFFCTSSLLAFILTGRRTIPAYCIYPSITKQIFQHVATYMSDVSHEDLTSKLTKHLVDPFSFYDVFLNQCRPYRTPLMMIEALSPSEEFAQTILFIYRDMRQAIDAIIHWELLDSAAADTPFGDEDMMARNSIKTDMVRKWWTLPGSWAFKVWSEVVREGGNTDTVWWEDDECVWTWLTVVAEERTGVRKDSLFAMNQIS
ncbi:hypothetical protein HDU85_000776 [Gaertneriomyces sp. JEL0708]|nr:hypothetical protein HDU85_000776 [Gaertneriomyces sp. JEL0708]